jgi:hypothetical protein
MENATAKRKHHQGFIFISLGRIDVGITRAKGFFLGIKW